MCIGCMAGNVMELLTCKFKVFLLEVTNTIPVFTVIFVFFFFDQSFFCIECLICKCFVLLR